VSYTIKLFTVVINSAVAWTVISKTAYELLAITIFVWVALYY
jgi:hypothetical protein